MKTRYSNPRWNPFPTPSKRSRNSSKKSTITKRSRIGSLLDEAAALGGSYLGGPVAGSLAKSASSMARRKLSNYFKSMQSAKSMSIDGGKNNGAKKQALNQEQGITIRNPVQVRKYNPKVSKFSKKKRVRVSHKFVSKVHRALNSLNHHGTWKQISYGYLNTNAIPQNTQGVNALYNTFGDSNNMCFHPTVFLHQVSVLWNNKADSQGVRQLADVYNLGINTYTGSSTVAAGADVTVGAQGSGAGTSQTPLNIKFTVKHSYEKVRLKNNTERAVTLKLILAAPKVIGSSTTSQVQLTNGAIGGVTVNDPILAPHTMWANALQKQNYENINLNSALVTDLYMSPLKCPELKKHYSFEITTVLLEPGQNYEWTISGPSDFELNYDTFFRNGIYMDMQKFVRYPFYIAYNDLAYGSTSGYGRLTGGETIQKIVMEREMYASFTMPEQVLGTHIVKAVGTITTDQANLRRNAYFHEVYAPVDVSAGTATRVEELNPTAVQPI